MLENIIFKIALNLGVIDITEHLGVEVKNTQNLEMVIIQHVMIPHTVLAQAMPPVSFFVIQKIFILDINIFITRST